MERLVNDGREIYRLYTLAPPVQTWLFMTADYNRTVIKWRRIMCLLFTARIGNNERINPNASDNQRILLNNMILSIFVLQV